MRKHRRFLEFPCLPLITIGISLAPGCSSKSEETYRSGRGDEALIELQEHMIPVQSEFDCPNRSEWSTRPVFVCNSRHRFEPGRFKNAIGVSRVETVFKTAL